MNLGLGSLVSPKAGLTIVKNALEKTIGQKLLDFDVIYKHAEGNIDFRLYQYTDENGKYHDRIVLKYAEGEKLCGIIKNMLQEKISKTDVINFAVINFKNMQCDLYIVRESEKKKLTYKL